MDQDQQRDYAEEAYNAQLLREEGGSSAMIVEVLDDAGNQESLVIVPEVDFDDFCAQLPEGWVATWFSARVLVEYDESDETSDPTTN